MKSDLLLDVAIRLYGIDPEPVFAWRRLLTLISSCPVSLSSFPSVAAVLQLAFIAGSLAYCFKKMMRSDIYLPTRLLICLCAYVVATTLSNIAIIKYESLY